MRLPPRDLELIDTHCTGVWPKLRARKLFVTGGTGFFGRWLLESLDWVNTHLQLQVHATVLSRNPSAFAAVAPHLAASPWFRFVAGDIRSMPRECDERGPYDYIVHMATDTDAASHREPLRLLDSIIDGTRSVLDLALRSKTQAVLLTSSGAVYGRQPPQLTHIPEDYSGAPDVMSPASVYGEGKRVAELLGASYEAEHNLSVKVARCFAFVGPHLPLDGHFAIGNFIRDALTERSIAISGDGSPYRSYLYAADLTVWLWTILVNGPSGVAFNVGSGEAVTIAETARAVAACVRPHLPVRIAREPNASALAQRYVPSVERAAAMLGLRQTVTLPDAIERTLDWHRAQAALRGSAP